MKVRRDGRWPMVMVLAAIFFLLSVAAVSAQESSCVSCHTDKEQLKKMAKLIPPKPKSAEKEGTG